jgi:hypothetical protein
VSKPEPGDGSKPQPDFQGELQGKSRGSDSRRGAIAGLIVVAAILALGLWLARDLTAASKMQDCLMSGRTNCNVIEPAR